MSESATRCVWCTRVLEEELRYCPDCATERVSPADYGVARMLKAGGVDQLSIPERLKTLAPEQRAIFESRWQEQLDALQPHIENVRALEADLLHEGFAEDFEQTWFARLPLSEQGLELMREHPTELESDLLAIRTVRALEGGREAFSRVIKLLDESDLRRAREAALALSYWRLDFQPRLGFGTGVIDKMDRILEPLATDAGAPRRLRLWAVIAWIRRIRLVETRPLAAGSIPRYKERTKVREVLQEALEADEPLDDELRFACALTLGNEVELSRALQGSDEQMREAAIRKLASQSSALIVQVLRDASPDAQRQQLRRIPSPAPALLLQEVLDWSLTTDDDVLDEVVRWVTDANFDEYDEDGKDVLVSWLERHAGVLRAERRMDVLRWVMSGPDERDGRLAPPMLDGRREVLVGAIAPSLEDTGNEERAALVRHGTFQRLLFCVDLPPVTSLLVRWALEADENVAGRFWEAVSGMDQLAAWWDHPWPIRARDVLLRLWEATDDFEHHFKLAAGAGAHWHWAYSQDRAATFTAWWEQYVADPGERVLWRIALAGLSSAEGRDMVTEAHREILEEPLGGDDPIEFLRVLTRAQPSRLYDNTKLLWDAGEISLGEKAVRLVRLVFASVRNRESDTQMLPPVVLLCREIHRFVRDGVEAGELEALQATFTAFMKEWEALQPHIPRARDSAESYYTKEKRGEVEAMEAAVLEALKVG